MTRTLVVDDSQDIDLVRSLLRDHGISVQEAEPPPDYTSLIESERRARALAETLSEANLALVREGDLEAVLETLLDHLARLVPYDSANVMLLDREGRLAVRVARGYEGLTDARATGRIAFEPGSNLLLQAILTGVPVLVPDSREEPRWQRIPGTEHVRNWLGVPLVQKDRTIGVFSLDKVEPAYFTQEHVRLAQALAPTAATAIAIARLLTELREQGERLERAAEAANVGFYEWSQAGKDAPDAFGEVRGHLFDVPRQAHLEEQLRQAQKMEAVGRLAAGVAHDFDHLLATISAHCDLALGRVAASSDAETHDHLREVRSAAESALQLTQALLVFGRRDRLPPAPLLDLNDAIRAVEGEVRRFLGEDVELVTTLAPGLGWIAAEPGQIARIIVNLAANARDAMPHGGILELATSLVDLEPAETWAMGGAKPGAYVRLSVKDTGLGMDRATMSHLFEPFFTTKAAGTATGLGLATVYGIVNRCGGAIRVTSSPGRGTAFAIHFPRARPKG